MTGRERLASRAGTTRQSLPRLPTDAPGKGLRIGLGLTGVKAWPAHHATLDLALTRLVGADSPSVHTSLAGPSGRFCRHAICPQTAQGKSPGLAFHKELPLLLERGEGWGEESASSPKGRHYSPVRCSPWAPLSSSRKMSRVKWLLLAHEPPPRIPPTRGASLLVAIELQCRVDA